MFKSLISLLIIGSVSLSGSASAMTRTDAIRAAGKCDTNVHYAESYNEGWRAICVPDDLSESESDACNDVAGSLDCTDLSRHDCITTMETIYDACVTISQHYPGAVYWTVR